VNGFGFVKELHILVVFKSNKISFVDLVNFFYSLIIVANGN